jgi:hypothetical protein
VAKAKDKLILTDEGEGQWGFEIRQADAHMNLSGLQMMREFRKGVDCIIKLMENEGKKSGVKHAKR